MGAIGLIGLLAIVSLRLSALPMPMMWALSALSAAYSAFLIRRELRREPFTFVWAGGDAVALLNFASAAQSLSGPKLSIRGSLASVSGKDAAGRVQRYLWWPDTLSSAARRQLRLVDQITKERQDQSSKSKTA